VASLVQSLRPGSKQFEKLAANAPRWLAGLLAVLTGIQAATLTAQLAAGPEPVAAASTRPAPVRNLVDVPSILRANLFGQSAAVAGAAPVSSMALQLIGVIASDDEKRGFAMIGESTANVRVYSVGGNLPGGAVLHAVQVDRVLISRGGAIEALLLPPRNPGSATTAAPPPLVSTNGANRVQQLMRDNPGIVGQVIRPQMVMAEGKQRGFRVYPGPNAQAFNRLGLRPGDLVIAINGTALNDPTRSNEIFSTLGNSADARVTVERNGSQQELALNLADIANEAEKLSQITPPVDVASGEGVRPATTR
jgi:general secretion pathway protein C